jgi:hypothetical protein
MRKLGKILIGVVVVYLALVAGLAMVMRQPPAVFGRIMAKMPGPMFMLLPFESLWMQARAGSLSSGDPAPAFSLPTLDRKTAVRLEEHRGVRPVVLVFGSYT